MGPLNVSRYVYDKNGTASGWLMVVISPRIYWVQRIVLEMKIEGLFLFHCNLKAT